MGVDREFFSDSKHGFQIWKPEKELLPGESLFCSAEVSIPADGRYCIQFSCNNALAVKLGDEWYGDRYGNRRFPMLHNVIPEYQMTLKKGKNILKVQLSNPTEKEVEGKFAARLLDEAGNILEPETVMPLPELETRIPQNCEPDLSSYTAGAGKAFRSFGRFGFSKGDGVLDCSMPSFGIVARPFVSGHPQYHKNLVWHFSLLPDGEETSGSLYKTYHVPDNETVENDWSGVHWTRRLKNGKQITFDYSILTPVLLVETDLDYVNLSSLKGISAWKKITLPLADGLHIRRVDDSENDLCYDQSQDGPLSRNYVLFTNQGEFPDVPLQIIVKRSPKRIRVKRDSRNQIEGFRFEFARSADYLMLLFPCGIELFQPHEVTEEKITEWSLLCQKYAQRALARPVSCADHYKASRENVEVIQMFSYRYFEDEWHTPYQLFAPLPPPLSIAEEHVPEIRLDRRCVREKFPTKYGYLYGVEYSTFSSYTLPVPDTRRDLAFPAEKHDDLQQKLESDFDEFMSYHLDAPEVGNPGNYSFVFQYSFVLMVFHLLSPEKRKKLEAVIRDGLKKVCDPYYSYVGPGKRKCYSWYNRKEPFSGLDFNMTYLHVTGINRFQDCEKETIENTDILMIETDWGNAMSLYGTYFGALFTGAWDLIAENWQVFRHAFDYYLHGMDWACMCASYCENGVSWSDGTNYGGYLGFINMAEMLEKEDDLALGRYAFGKMFAMRAGLFHAAQHYFCKYLDSEPWYCSKFFHEETDAGRAFLSYPASFIHNGCRAGALYNIATEGHYKEAFDAYCRFMGDEMRKLLKAFRYSYAKAPWEERLPDAQDVYHTILPDGVPGWQEVYTFFMFCIQLGSMSREKLEEKISLALKNKRIAREFLGHVQWSKRRVPAYWTYTYLLSTLYGKDQAKLTFWKDVKLGKALYPELEISLIGKNPFLEFRSGKMPAVTLNGKPIDTKPTGNALYRIFPKESGIIRLEIP
ncbi:MAG: hypothetical protein J6X55_17540 [Victivallales bacterium]|nr:hypothetical protein [Victivallales bacterium]